MGLLIWGFGCKDSRRCLARCQAIGSVGNVRAGNVCGVCGPGRRRGVNAVNDALMHRGFDNLGCVDRGLAALKMAGCLLHDAEASKARWRPQGVISLVRG